MGNGQAKPSKATETDVGDVADAVRKATLADPESDKGSDPTATAASAAAVTRESKQDPPEREPERAGGGKKYLPSDKRSMRDKAKKKRDADKAGGGPDEPDDTPMVAGGPGENFDASSQVDDPDEQWGDTVTWLEQEMSTMRIKTDYPDILQKCVEVLRKWRASFPKSVWVRVIKSGRIAKELNECAPVIDRVIKHVEETVGVPKDPDQRVNIVDLCSGFGYLGMFLSEFLDPEKVKMIVLLDKQWPMHNSEPKPHQINWDHVYGVKRNSTNETEVPYETTSSTENATSSGTNKGTSSENDSSMSWTPDWPIPLRTRKMDIKQAGQLRQMEQHVFQKFSGPFCVLAVHLCGTLSVKAVEMFNAHDTCSILCLKPCCLPEWNHTYTHDNWVFPKREGVVNAADVSQTEADDSKTNLQETAYRIPTTDVCAPGKWKNNKWFGPPRAHLRKKFELWTDHLCRAVDVDVSEKSLESIKIQEDGGHQNLFVFAERTAFATTPQPPRGRYGGGEDPHDTVSEQESKRRRAADRKRDKANGERSKRLEEERAAAKKKESEESSAGA